MLFDIFKKYESSDLLLNLCASSFNKRKVEKIHKQVSLEYTKNDLNNFLLLCVEKNLLESIKWLLTKSIDINFCDEQGNTFLIIASKLGFFEVSKILLEKNCNPDIRNKRGRTAIQEAVKHSQKNIYHLLKKNLKNINNVDCDNHCLVYDAVDSNNIDFVKLIFLNKSIKIPNDILFYEKTYKNLNIFNLIFKNLDMKSLQIGKNGKNPFFYLVKKGIACLKSFKYLSSLSYDLNQIDNLGNNILLELIIYFTNNEHSKEERKSLLEMITFLIDENIDYSLVNKAGHNVLTYLTNINNIFLLKYLLEHGINPNIQDSQKNTALSCAAIKGSKNLDLVTLLLKYNANTNVKDINNKSIIEKLISYELIINSNKKLSLKNKEEIDYEEDYLSVLQKILLSGKNNFEVLNSFGEPYFFDVIEHNNMPLLKLLISYGADINQNDQNKCNIIFKYLSFNSINNSNFAEKEYYSTLAKIITLGANPNCIDSYGGTTLHKAILVSDLQTCKILIKSGANIDVVDSRGRSMVHNTIWKNKIDIFKLLHLLNKELINKVDQYGVLPINYAAFLGHHKLVLVLIEKGAYINNSYSKSEYIQGFLKKFHKNLSSILDNVTNENDKNKVQALVKNMNLEFNIKIKK